MFGKKNKEAKKKITYVLYVYLGGDSNTFSKLTKEEAFGYNSDIENGIKSGAPNIIKIDDTNIVISKITSWSMTLETEVDEGYY